MAFAIECRDLKMVYDGGVDAVRGVSLAIAPGECFGLLGPNGAGKTTVIEILEGLLVPTAGEVSILGHPWTAESRHLRERLGVSLQETRLLEKLTVAETVRLFASFHTRTRPVSEVLDLLQLAEKRDVWVGKLSGGQRQRLAVATALVGDPSILFLDEPTTGLDPQSRRQLWDVIHDFRRAGGTVLLTTHYMDEAERLCDRLAIMDRGQIIAEGSPGHLIQGLGGLNVIELELSEDCDEDTFLKWRAVPGVEGARRDNRLIFLNVRESRLAIPALLDVVRHNGAQIVRLTTRNATLEDVFVQLTGRTLREN